MENIYDIDYNRRKNEEEAVNMVSGNQSSLELFQNQVSQLLLRHRSVLDILSKINQTSAAVNRSVTKSVTDCGCISLQASRQPFDQIETLDMVAKEQIPNHVSGDLCDHCKEYIESQLGKNLFYLTALCTQLGIGLEEVLQDEAKKCSTLGLFNLT